MGQENNIHSPLVCVPKEKRVLGFWDLATLFFSLGIGLAVIQSGADVGLLTGSVSFYSILTGSLIGTFFLALVGIIGSKTGLSSMASLQISFGKQASFIPTLLNIVQLIGWGCFEIIILRESAVYLCQHFFAADPQSLLSSKIFWSIIIGGIATFIAILGPLSGFRVYLKKFFVWLVLASCIWLTWNLFSTTHLTQVVHSARGELSFGGGVDLVIPMAFSFLPIVGDYTRFSKNARQSFWGVFIGFFCANFWMTSLGAALALAFTHSSESAAFLKYLATIGLGLPLLFILMNETDDIFNDIYPAGVSAALFVKLPVRTLCIIVGIVSILIAIFVPIGEYTSFLIAIGSIFAPLFGVVIFDYLYYIRRNLSLEGKFFSYAATFSWVFGIAIYYVFQHYQLPLGATVPSLVASALFKYGFSFFAPRPQK